MARWRMAQSQLLRGYVSQSSPCDKLVSLELYVLAVYVPTILAIRCRSDLVKAPRHLFGELERQRRHLSGARLEAVWKSVARNVMMLHPENIVLAMLDDDHWPGRSSISGCATAPGS